MRVLVTGSEGFLGQRVSALLEWQGHEVVQCDIGQDVLSPSWTVEADAAIHLAAHKHAGHGEEHPADVAELNIVGTRNVVDQVPRVVLASTCKAAAPITCYGASKLIAERIVLNAGGTVVRLVNVLGSSGSVAELWNDVPAGEPLPLTDCKRMFMGPGQAAQILVDALELPPGRYAPAGRELCSMLEMARTLHPGREVQIMPLRRGDRPVERLLNDYERSEPYGMYERIVDCWEEPQQQRQAA